jgi:hypothetical protein
MFSATSVQSISPFARRRVAARRARRARSRESAGSRAYSSGIKLRRRHLEFHELSPLSVWFASASGPFLIRHRDELLDELAELGPRLVEGLGKILQGGALAPRAGEEHEGESDHVCGAGNAGWSRGGMGVSVPSGCEPADGLRR